MDKEAFANLTKSYIRKLGMTYKRFAEYADISEDTVKHWCTRKVEAPRVENLRRAFGEDEEVYNKVLRAVYGSEDPYDHPPKSPGASNDDPENAAPLVQADCIADFNIGINNLAEDGVTPLMLQLSRGKDILLRYALPPVDADNIMLNVKLGTLKEKAPVPAETAPGTEGSRITTAPVSEEAVPEPCNKVEPPEYERRTVMSKLKEMFKGSAKVSPQLSSNLATPRDVKAYMKRYSYPKGKTYAEEPDGAYSDAPGNLILGQNLRLNMNVRDTYLNDNVLVIGGPGAGKSRSYGKPNIMQMNTSYIVLDPCGEYYKDTSRFLRDAGYEVRVLDISGCLKEERPEHYETELVTYSPFVHISDRKAAAELAGLMVEAVDIKTVDGIAETGYEEAIKEEAKMALSAVLTRQRRLASADKKNSFDETCLMLDGCSELKGSGQFLKEARALATAALNTFKGSFAGGAVPAADTTCMADMGYYRQALYVILPADMRNLTAYTAFILQFFQETVKERTEIDNSAYAVSYGKCMPLFSRRYISTDAEDAQSAREELEKKQEMLAKEAVIKEYAEERRFVIEQPDGTVIKSFRNKEAASVYLEAIKKGYVRQATCFSPCHVHMLLDEFGSLSKIPELFTYINSMRKMSVSCSFFIQTIGQLKKVYGEEAVESIFTPLCCTTVYMGNSSVEDMKWIIRNRHGVHTTVTKTGGKAVREDSSMTYEELRKIAASGESVVFVSENMPMLDKKLYINGEKAPWDAGKE